MGDLLCVLELHLVLDSLYGQQRRVNFLTTDNWRKWGYLCLFGMCCFKNGARFIDLLERFIWQKGRVRNFGGYPLCLMLDYMERKEYA